MKKVWIAVIALCTGGYTIAQSIDGTAELQKNTLLQKQHLSQPAALIYLPYSPQVVIKALAYYAADGNNKQQENMKAYVRSPNTLIVKNNRSNADMIFQVGLKDVANKNESVLYLKLNSTSNSEDSTPGAIQFYMQDAKEYLNNLAIAIQPYASKLQIELQEKNLAKAMNDNNALVVNGNKLEEKQRQLRSGMNTNENYRKDDKLAKRLATNTRLIDENHTARIVSTISIEEQTKSLTQLKSKQQ
jgi:hypothetical protein